MLAEVPGVIQDKIQYVYICLCVEEMLFTYVTFFFGCS